jgi:hypothetical protein
MMRTTRRSILVFSVAWAMAACNTATIPTHALEGSTVTLLLDEVDITPEMLDDGWTIGFRSAMSAPGLHWDSQRGQLHVVLCPTSLPIHCAAPPGVEVDVRAVTRLHPDPASEAGIYNNGNLLGSSPDVSLIVALLDLPTGTNPESTPTDWRLEVGLRRPAAGTPQSPTAWEYYPDLVIPPRAIRIYPKSGPPTYNLFKYVDWNNWQSGGSDMGWQVALQYPHPTLVIRLPIDAAGTPPAAARLVLRFPTPPWSAPWDVFEHNHLGRSQIVRWAWDGAAREVEINLVDPDQEVREIGIALSLDEAYPIQERLEAGDFTISVGVFYDINGAEIAGTATPVGII